MRASPSLRFNGALEDTYQARSFTESFPTVIAFCLGIVTLLGVLTLAVPGT